MTMLQNKGGRGLIIEIWCIISLLGVGVRQTIKRFVARWAKIMLWRKGQKNVWGKKGKKVFWGRDGQRKDLAAIKKKQNFKE